MASFNLKRSLSWPYMRELLEALFSATAGHAHDGTENNGPQLAVGALADNAVETAKIKDANVTAAKLATDAVETVKIKAKNVTSAKIADECQPGLLASLTTTAKTTLVAAVNELVTNIGTLASLTTSAKTSLVAAVNELVTSLTGYVAAVSTGYRLARSNGAAAVTGTLEITSGLSTVVSVTAVLAEDPSADATIVTVVIPAQTGGDAGKFTVKVWKPTAADNSAPTAALVAKNVTWIAIGT